MDEVKLPLINVLVSLYKGYGLGDAVQMSAVLKHVQKHRSHWIVDFQAERGREKVGAGLARNCFCYGEPYPSSNYDVEVQILLHDTFANWSDRPNTRVTSCLHERFGIEWDRECSRYEIRVSHDASRAVREALGAGEFVAVHYFGDSDKANKDLSHEQASAVCDRIVNLGRVPLILDWRGVSPLSDRSDVRTTKYMREWGHDAEYNCAVIRLCEAFVGIDSGPSKCASSTDTPALVTWTGHHPAPFHDPAPNTTHLVPFGYHGLKPVLNDPGVVAFFEAEYSVRKYEHDPVKEIERWLAETLSRG